MDMFWVGVAIMSAGILFGAAIGFYTGYEKGQEDMARKVRDDALAEAKKAQRMARGAYFMPKPF